MSQVVWLILTNQSALFQSRYVTLSEILYQRLPPGIRAVVVDHLVERSLPTPEIRGANPVKSGNLYIRSTKEHSKICATLKI